jgi:hypothetical protein
MYGRAFGWEWFTEIVPDWEQFPTIEYSTEAYIIHLFHIVVYVNRKK